jgi:tetratricopeptide (TPR) repeat protein
MRIAFAAILMALCACTSGTGSELLDQTSARLDIDGSNPGTFTRHLGAGTYLLEVREDEIDLRVQVDAGELHESLSDQVPRHGRIYAYIALPADAELHVELRSTDHKTKQGHADVKLLRWEHPAGASPTELERGFMAFDAAGRRCALGTPAGWAGAADKLNDAVFHFTAAQDSAARAEAAYSLASLQYNVRDEWAAAVRAAEIARDAYESAGDEAGLMNAVTTRAAAQIYVAATMNSSSHGADQKALYATADRRLSEGVDYFAEHGLPVRAEYAVNMRAVGAVNVGNYDVAEKLLAKAVSMARANHDVAEEARSLGNLASVHNLRGYMTLAAREYQALLPIVDRSSYQYAMLLGNYGFTLIALGDFDRALALHLEALALFTKMGHESERATALAALGGLYLRMGDAGHALDTLRSAIHRDAWRIAMGWPARYAWRPVQPRS